MRLFAQSFISDRARRVRRVCMRRNASLSVDFFKDRGRDLRKYRDVKFLCRSMTAETYRR